MANGARRDGIGPARPCAEGDRPHPRGGAHSFGHGHRRSPPASSTGAVLPAESLRRVTTRPEPEHFDGVRPRASIRATGAPVINVPGWRPETRTLAGTMPDWLAPQRRSALARHASMTRLRVVARPAVTCAIRDGAAAATSAGGTRASFIEHDDLAVEADQFEQIGVTETPAGQDRWFRCTGSLRRRARSVRRRVARDRSSPRTAGRSRNPQLHRRDIRACARAGYSRLCPSFPPNCTSP